MHRRNGEPNPRAGVGVDPLVSRGRVDSSGSKQTIIEGPMDAPRKLLYLVHISLM